MPARLAPRLARCPPRSPLPSCLLASRNVHSAPSTRARYDWSKSRSAISGDNDSFDPSKLRRLSAEQLATHRAPPKGVKVLVRDFIHDALYNPHYGYFSHRAVIFSPPAPLDFRQMRNAAEFDETVARVYADISQARGTSTPTIGAQLWHTPVELFQVSACRPSIYLVILHADNAAAMVWTGYSERLSFKISPPPLPLRGHDHLRDGRR